MERSQPSWRHLGPQKRPTLLHPTVEQWDAMVTSCFPPPSCSKESCSSSALSEAGAVCDWRYAWLGCLVVLGGLKDPCPDAIVA